MYLKKENYKLIQVLSYFGIDLFIHSVFHSLNKHLFNKLVVWSSRGCSKIRVDYEERMHDISLSVFIV